MASWLQVQTTKQQVRKDIWTDVMSVSSDDPRYSVRDLIDHGRYLVQFRKCLRARIIERSDD